MIKNTMNPQKKSSRSAKLFRALRVVLAGVFCIQAALLYLAQRDVELPDFVCKWAAEKFAPAGTRLEIGGGIVRNLVFWELNDIRLKSASGTESLATARRAGAYFNWKNFFTPGKYAQVFFCDGARINCPAIRSQSGSLENVISGGRLEASYSFGEIHLREFFARVAGIPFSASGIVALSDLLSEKTEGKSESHPGKNANSALVGFYDFAGALSEVKQVISAWGIDENTEIRFRFEPAESGDFWAGAQLFCGNLSLPEFNLSSENIYVRAEATLDLRERRILSVSPVRVSAKSLRGVFDEKSFLDSWRISARDVNLALEMPKADFKTLPGRFAVSAREVRAENFLQGEFEFSGVTAQASSSDWEKSGSAILNFISLNSPIALQIDFDKSSGTRLVADGEIDFSTLLRVPQISGTLPPEVKELKFSDAPRIRAEISLSPEWEFLRADYDVSADATTWKTVNAVGICSSGFITKKELNIDSAQVRGENFCANTRIFVDFGPEKKYRVQTFGSIENPEVLDDYLGWFWWRIWNNLKRAPSAKAPRADIDVYGTWDDDSNWEYIYGAIAGENAVGGGVPVDKVRLRIAEEPEFIAAFDMGFECRGESIAGTLQWHYALEPEYHYRDFRFAFSGAARAFDVFNIVGEGLPEIFADVLTCDAAGTARVRGYISGSEKFYPEERVMVEVDVESVPGEFEFMGIEGANFCGKICYDSGNVRIAPFYADCDEGNVSGEILVKFPPTSEAAGTSVVLDLKLQNISARQLKNALENLAPDVAKSENVELVEKAESTPPAKQGDSLARADAVFKASMILPEISTLEADGAFFYRDPELYDLQVFGGFSRFLQTIKIPLTSFAFTEAESSFLVENGKIYLPDLKITGEGGEITARVNMDIATKDLEGKAVFKNRRFTDIPLLGKIFDLASETTSLFPLDISGTLDDVQWKARPFGNLRKEKTNPGLPPDKNGIKENDESE